jgi:hypothetical protein
MKKFRICSICFAVCLVCIAGISAQTAIKPPETEISNGIIHARLYLPDSIGGYNRGPRFDWAGIIYDLKYSGHSFFGKWQDTYSSTAHDAAMGPAEVFDPLGFDEAKAGQKFIKIGIGALVKPDNSAYDFMASYNIANHGKWKTEAQADQVRFVQVLKEGEYAYKYQKCIQLKKGEPVMLIIHTLKNTGKKSIETSVYDHNFFVIDGSTTGPGSVVSFPFPLKENVSSISDFVNLNGNQLQFTKELRNKFVSFPDLTHGERSVYAFNVENRTTGAGVKITGDKPITKLAFWSSLKTFCPEPYINISMKPGQEFSWTLTYTYYTISH